MDRMDNLVSLCKRRGFIFPSSEIYGGLNGCWDYGPLGVELKRNIKDAWWRDMVVNHDEHETPAGAPSPFSMVGLDCSIIMNPRVWEASGHVGGFSDPMVDCRESKKRYRADQLHVLIAYDPQTNDDAGLGHFAYLENDDASKNQATKKAEKAAKRLKASIGSFRSLPLMDVPAIPESANRFALVVGPDVDVPGTLTEPRSFNLMFKTYVGALEDSSSVAYLRPETAQGIFVNFKNVCDTGRVRIPFGIAQMGKAFRNEINPRNFTFRSREFEQMEIEFFCHPDTADAWYQYWRNRRHRWYIDHGLKSEKLRLRDHEPKELAHYARGCADVEYEFPFGISELEGIANRTDFDLTQHTKHSGKDLQYFDDQVQDKDKRKYMPYVIEPSAGADRATLAFLCEAYHEDTVEGEARVSMRFHPRLAPIKAAVFPLVKKDGMPEKALALYRKLKQRCNVFYDDKGAIGRRYRRMDEAGTPYCITVDGQTNDDDTVTVRDRDSLAQIRMPARELPEMLAEKIGSAGS